MGVGKLNSGGGGVKILLKKLRAKEITKYPVSQTLPFFVGLSSKKKTLTRITTFY